MKTTERCHVNTVVLVSSQLTLKKIHTLFWWMKVNADCNNYFQNKIKDRLGSSIQYVRTISYPQHAHMRR